MTSPESKGMNIRAKLLSGAALLLGVAVIIGVIALTGFSRSSSFIGDMAGKSIPQLTLANSIESNIASARRYEKEFLLISSLGRRDQEISEKQMVYHNNVLDHYDKAGSAITSLRDNGGEDLSQVISQLRAAHGETLKSLAPLASKVFEGRSFSEVGFEYRTYQKNAHDMEEAVGQLKEAVGRKVKTAQEDAVALKSLLTKTLVAACVFVIIAGMAGAMILLNKFTAGFDKLLHGIRSVSSGDAEEIHIHSGDELDEIAMSFNETVGRLKAYIRTEEEQKKTQQNVIEFLDVVSQAADGDLTVSAPVTADVFGNIADAYNLMMSSLADLMLGVRRSANEVGSEARRLLDIFKTMEMGAESQMTQVKQTTEAVDETSATTQEIAQKAKVAQEASLKVDTVTSQGHGLVVQNIEGMQMIRIAVQTINKKMKSLSERLLEIGTISQLISEVASRTTILAMNASIEAARAGAQGRGFLVIADEIKTLADKSSEATKQINGVIKAIQAEASEVTSALDEETKTVETQTRLAHDTGEAFTDIEKAVGDSKAVVSEIFGMAQRQRELTNTMVLSMEEVQRVSLQALALVKNSATISHGLNKMSESLLGSVSKFRLPELTDSSFEKGEHTEEILT